MRCSWNHPDRSLRCRTLHLEALETRELLTAEFVLHFSVDGLSGTQLDLLLSKESQSKTGDFANFLRLTQEGAYTSNARTDYTHTLTLPNHTSMLTGRPVLPPAGAPATTHHNWTSNIDPAPQATLHSNHPAVDYVASVFDVVHDAGLTTALYASKSKFSIFTTSYDAGNGALDLDPTGGDNGRNKIDRSFIAFDVDNVIDALIQDFSGVGVSLSDGPANYTFLHSRLPDSAGHQFQWASEAWIDSVKQTDRDLGRILAAIEQSPRMRGRTAIVLTSDHGGSGFSHSEPHISEHYTIPFFVWGPGVPAGANLYSLYTTTTSDPQKSRPDYNASRQPIRNGDSGNLALEMLGLPVIPGSTINRLTSCRETNSCEAVSNHAPEFSSVRSFLVDENAPIGTLVGVVSAHDPDDDALTFEFISGATGTFAINGTNGEITTRQSLDFESTPVYRLQLRVTDPHGLSDATEITVNVRNVRENLAPSLGSNLEFTIAGDALPGTSVGHVTANDPDGDALVFELVGGNADGVFAIHANTGELTVVDPTSLTSHTPHILQVRVKDPGNLFGVGPIAVHVTPVEENEPPRYLVVPSFSIPENTAVGTELGAVIATDPDGDEVSYTIADGGFGDFAINQTNGVIRVAEPLDFSRRSAYSLSIQATDSRGLHTTVTTTIAITDATIERPPNFIETTLSHSISSQAAVGTIVGIVLAEDLDGDAITFEVLENQESYFDVHATTGRITTARPLTALADATHALQIRVTDETGLFSVATATIEVVAVQENRPPVFEMPLFFEVSESATIGSVVGTLSVHDPDDDPVSLEVVAGNDGASFHLDSTSGNLVTQRELNFESQSTYVLVVRATDSNGAYDEAEATVSVTNDSRDTPTFRTFPLFRVAENQPTGTLVASVIADDPNHEAITYSVSGNDRFTIDPDTGEISTRQPLDYETAQEHQLLVQATNVRGEFAVKQLTIEIIDLPENQPPSFSPQGDLFVPENVPVGHLVGTVTASDPEGGRLVFELVAGDHGDFAIDADSGQITVQRPLNFSVRSDYPLTLRVEDSSGDFDTLGLLVRVGSVTKVGSWHNVEEPLDVDADGELSPLDALLVINELVFRNISSTGSGVIFVEPDAANTTFFDVNQDDMVSPLDALLVINELVVKDQAASAVPILPPSRQRLRKRWTRDSNDVRTKHVHWEAWRAHVDAALANTTFEKSAERPQQRIAFLGS